MDSRTRVKFLSIASLSLTAFALLISGCVSSLVGNPGNSSDALTGPAFVVGTDAPVASVVSFSVPVESVTATDSSGTTMSLISGTPTVDFARFNGLQTLLDINDVPEGTYTSISITIGTPTIGYLNVPASGAPRIQTQVGTYPASASTSTRRLRSAPIRSSRRKRQFHRSGDARV